MPVPIPPDEAQRLLALAQYDVLDTEAEQAYDDITLIASQICRTPVAVISLIDSDRTWFKSKVGLKLSQTSRELAFSSHAIMGKHIFEVGDASRDERFHTNPLVTNNPNVRFYAGAPLINPRGHAIGTLCVIDTVPRSLEPGQAQALEALGRQVVAQLELRKTNSRLKTDLHTAARVQRALLPASSPTDTRAEFAWVFQPCDELGGDILNVFELDEHRIGFYLLDVSGHGVAAALMSVSASRMLAPLHDQTSLVRKRLSRGNTLWQPVAPAQVAHQLNQRFTFDDNTTQYFTLLYGLLDAQSRQARFVCAGHPSPIHLPCDGEPTNFDASGVPIGMVDCAEYAEWSLSLRPGDRLFLHSDGVTEALNAQNQPFGDARLLQQVRATRCLPLNESVQSIYDAARNFSGDKLTDDVSILALQMR